LRAPRETSSYGEALRLSTVGITLALCVAIGTGGGVWLDRHFETEPLLTVIGFLLGTAAGFVELFRAIRPR
jgi:ATP synthase protein I